MLSSYYLGQKHFPVPYDVKRILTYILSAVLTYGIYHLMVRGMTAIPIKLVIGFVLCIAYATIVFISDKEEFSRLPILSKWLTR